MRNYFVIGALLTGLSLGAVLHAEEPANRDTKIIVVEEGPGTVLPSSSSWMNSNHPQRFFAAATHEQYELAQAACWHSYPFRPEDAAGEITHHLIYRSSSDCMEHTFELCSDESAEAPLHCRNFTHTYCPTYFLAKDGSVCRLTVYTGSDLVPLEFPFDRPKLTPSMMSRLSDETSSEESVPFLFDAPDGGFVLLETEQSIELMTVD